MMGCIGLRPVEDSRRTEALFFFRSIKGDTMISEALQEEIKRAYGFAALTVEKYFEGYGSAYVALLRTNEGKYVVKGKNNRDSDLFSVYNHLHKHNYPHLFKLRKPSGKQIFLESDGMICYVYAYMEGETQRTTDFPMRHLIINRF
ncbi:hypothetical protein GXP70_14420 [Paenibacillus lycopersici]|uniref:Uncharacterized protein n=1 Tax=Paenibacillus lycopersici TaxID=2704462 RepID=A0A6C0FV64_9BACL|nr:hypothetical protein [Paenibacillus lycopersici]QHT61028.1 hypothetical protein GXP70_14420 [Paenibacillus lycopersici]